MIEKLLTEMATKAQAEQNVISRTLENGLHLLAYPLNPGGVLAIGVKSKGAHRIIAQKVLRKRSTDLLRYGAWLPAVIADDSCYVVRKVKQIVSNSGFSLLTTSDVAAAQELLS